MTPRRAHRRGRALPALPGWLLSVERWLRTHPAAVMAATVVSVAVITLLKRRVHGGMSIALSYMIPVALCAYGVGLTAAVGVSIVVSALWVVDAAELELTAGLVPYLFLVRLLTDLGVATFAALAGAAARERERYIEAQRDIEQLRADLVSAFSHDLRSPLGTIIGFAELLREDVTGRTPAVEPAPAINTILTAAYRLEKLISDMLGATRSGGTPLLTISGCSADALVAELRAELDQAPRADGLALRWQIEPNLPQLQTDRSKLVSIVRNLVNNALKYSRRGTVWVRLAYDPAGDLYRIEVEDSGPGIAPEALPHLFDRFHSVAGSRRIDSFGLGLFIVKRFVDLLQGTLTVDSEPGRGTRMAVTIPRVLIEPAVGTPASPDTV
jgi:signal transduction histidine kinase